MRFELMCAVLTAIGKVVDGDVIIYAKDKNVSLPAFQTQSHHERRSYKEFLVSGVDGNSPSEITLTTSTPKPSCDVKRFLAGKCWLPDVFRSKTTPEPVTEPPTSPPPDLTDTKHSRAQIFNLGAFIIALFVSLAIALAGAFSCWCFRTFLKKGARRNLHNFEAPSAPPLHEENGMVMETLVRPAEPIRPTYSRTNSLPSYSTATAHVPYKPTLQDEPPPAYHSLFSTNGVS